VYNKDVKVEKEVKEVKEKEIVKEKTEMDLSSKS